MGFRENRNILKRVFEQLQNIRETFNGNKMENKGEIIIYQVKTLSLVEQAYLETIRNAEKRIKRKND